LINLDWHVSLPDTFRPAFALTDDSIWHLHASASFKPTKTNFK
jgi:hypothetical protein